MESWNHGRGRIDQVGRTQGANEKRHAPRMGAEEEKQNGRQEKQGEN